MKRRSPRVGYLTGQNRWQRTRRDSNIIASPRLSTTNRQFAPPSPDRLPESRCIVLSKKKEGWSTSVAAVLAVLAVLAAVLLLCYSDYRGPDEVPFDSRLDF